MTDFLSNFLPVGNGVARSPLSGQVEGAVREPPHLQLLSRGWCYEYHSATESISVRTDRQQDNGSTQETPKGGL